MSGISQFQTGLGVSGLLCGQNLNNSQDLFGLICCCAFPVLHFPKNFCCLSSKVFVFKKRGLGTCGHVGKFPVSGDSEDPAREKQFGKG